jgi:hypothetical protein
VTESMIQSGGLSFPAAGLRCRAQASSREDEALIKIRAQDSPRPLAFYVESLLVSPAGGVSLTREEVEGTVQVILLSRENGSATVEVPGEPVTFGPKVVVPSDDLE